MKYFTSSNYEKLPVRDSFFWRDELFITTNDGTYHHATGVLVSAKINIKAVKGELEYHGENAVFGEVYRYMTINKGA